MISVLTQRFGVPDERAKELERIHIALCNGCRSEADVICKIYVNPILSDLEKLYLAAVVGSVYEVMREREGLRAMIKERQVGLN